MFGFSGGGTSNTGAGFAGNSFGATTNNATVTGVSQEVANQIMATVKQDMESWEKSGQWAFSCYSCAKDCVSIPGLVDYSPEELRLEAYESLKARNTNYQAKVNQLTQEYRNMKNLLANPDNQLKQILINIYNKAPIGDYMLSNTGPSSIFASSGTNAANKSSIFGGSTAPAPNQGLFGGGNKSLFGGASNSGSTFGGAATFGGGASASGGGGSIFGGNSTNTATSAASGGIFGGASSTSTSGSGGTGLFGGGSTVAATTASGGGIFGGQTAQPAGNSIFGGGSVAPQAGLFSQPTGAQAQPTPGLFSQTASAVAPQPPTGFFSQASAPATSTPFGASSGGIFGGGASSNSAPGIFGNTSTAPDLTNSSTPFGGGGSTPGTGLFGGGGTQATTPFGASNTSGQQQQQATVQPASGDIFTKPSSDSLFIQPAEGGGLFGKAEPTPAEPVELDPSCVYSTLEELTADEIAAYNAPSFEAAHLPIIPPTQEMCVNINSAEPVLAN